MSNLARPSFCNAQMVLMSCACHPQEPASLALAGVVAQALAQHGSHWLPMPGLTAEVTCRVLQKWFPGADATLGLDWSIIGQAQRPEPRLDEVEEIMALLLSHAEPHADSEEAQAVACSLACASLGHNHLWQDLYLPSRTELSALLTKWFPSLAARNTHNMKWKKFFYKQLCELADINVCKAPTCNMCSDHALCFVLETDLPF